MEKNRGQKQVKKIYIVYHHIAHYRETIFDALMKDENFEYTILADIKPHMKALKIVTPEEKPGWRWKIIPTLGYKLKTHEFVWQKKVILSVLHDKFDGIIFLGDPHFISNWVAVLICKIRGIPCLEWGIAVMKAELGLKRFIRKLYLNLFQGHLLYGNWAREWLRDEGFEQRKLWVVYNSLDYKKIKKMRQSVGKEAFESAKRDLCGKKDIPLIFHSGRLVKRKKITFIIEALRRLKERGKTVHFLIVGDGPNREALQNLVRAMHLEEQVHFAGACYDEERLGLFMRMSDLAVAPGQLGLFAIHALAYGLPVLTHDNKTRIMGPEAESVIHGKTGMIYKQNDIDDFTEKLDQMLFPAPKKRILSGNCIDMVERYYNSEYQVKVFTSALRAFLPGS